MFCLLLSVCVLFLVSAQPRVLASSSSLNNSLLFLGLLSVLAEALQAPAGSCDGDCSSSAGAVLVGTD